MGETQRPDAVTGQQAETILAVLLTEREFQFAVQLLQAAQISFGAHHLAAAVDAKFRGAMPVNRQPAEVPPEEQPEETPEE